MKNLLYLSLPILVIATIISVNSCDNKLKSMKNLKTKNMRTEEVIEANNKLYAGLNEMFMGNFEPLNKLWSHSDSITFMGPFGGYLKGWDEIGKNFKEVSEMKLGGKIVCANMNVFAGNDVGYVTCVEQGTNIGPDGKLVNVNHRATNIFHLEDGIWRLVHHHTDISLQHEQAFDMEMK
ncbi:MAG: hypothetical protein CMF58_06415 [Lentimicrobiaceae bacterium]|jgi:ketosteroid isomerase-like protein|nr:hypothetical protein [Lentimicrobiaceae bacterium]MDG1901784.1 nuclear transport factor 2 family protein [Bacteroidales bacterium]MDG2081108.1 nuclear transport factor 2 family protein [Bacteroidales bacterium]|tara:strand:- start:17842 stop:18378 length:537 start_codon:yes stop_codon:yes gene_type:complete